MEPIIKYWLFIQKSFVETYKKILVQVQMLIEDLKKNISFDFYKKANGFDSSKS